MGAPIRSAAEELTIINKGQHAIGDLGLEIARDSKRGVDNTDPDFRAKILKLVLLRMFLQNILNDDGVINNFYASALNEKARNNILTGILKLSGLSGGSSIPKLTGISIPLVYYPSSNSYTSINTEATPGGITFENTNVDAPGEIVDTIDANSSNYAFYIVNVIGTGPGEGSRALTLTLAWRGTNTPTIAEYGGADVGGSTAGVTFSAAYNNGFIELRAAVPTDNWIIRGSRISFYNISFQNLPPPSLPSGGATGQLLRKASAADYDFQFFTLVWASLTDVTASLAEINFVTGTTSSIQGQLNAISILISNLTTALGNYLLLTGGTMSGAIAMGANKITGLGAATVNGDALRYEQLIGLYLLLTGGTMSGNIAMGGNKVTGLAAATANGDAVRFEQLLAYDDELIPWITTGITFGANWSASAGYGFGFRKIRGVVYLRGRIQCSVVPNSGDTIFTLPLGYRPITGIPRFVVASASISGGGNWMDIATTGVTTLWEMGKSVGVAMTNQAVHLDNVQFDIAH